MKRLSEDHKEIASGKIKDDEGYMAKVEMQKIMHSLEKLKKVIKSSDQQLPAWVQSKITKASDYIDIAADYLSSDVEMDEQIDTPEFRKRLEGLRQEIADTFEKKRQREEKERQEKETQEKSTPPRRSSSELPSFLNKKPNLKEELSLVDKILAEMIGDKPGFNIKKPKSLEDICKKHKVSASVLKKELKKGIKVEMEHTTDNGEAEMIALHHLDEIPDYYTRLLKMEKNSQMNENLRDWLKSGVGGGGWDRYNTQGKRVGKCGDAEEGDPYSACLSKEKAQDLGKEGIGNFVRRKREAQSEAGYDEKGEGSKGRKPVFVKTKVDEDFDVLEEKNEPTNPELWSKAKSLAKQKFDVYPSAYANLWASKWYKSKGGSWKSLDEQELPNSQQQQKQKQLTLNALTNQENVIRARKRAVQQGVPADSLDEQMTRLPMKTGNMMRVLISWRNRHISCQVFFPQIKTPNKVDITYEVNKVYPGAKVISFVPCEVDASLPIIQIQNGSKNYLINNQTIGEEKENKPLNKPMRTPGEAKKFKVYVRDPKTGNIVTVRFGDPNMDIKRDDPERRKNFRARHNCADAKDKTTPKYWSCYQWRAGKKVED